jgi:hypothetical protein
VTIKVAVNVLLAKGEVHMRKAFQTVPSEKPVFQELGLCCSGCQEANHVLLFSFNKKKKKFGTVLIHLLEMYERLLAPEMSLSGQRSTN